MTKIQAHRRNIAYSITIAVLGGLTLKFEPNESGHVVCDVADESAVDWLLQTPSAFRIYEEAVPNRAMRNSTAKKAVRLPEIIAPEGPQDRYVLVDGDNRLDLNDLDDEKLVILAQGNKVAFLPTDAGNVLRERIVSTFQARAAA